ncbi:TraR/DksA family transcriptional regulator [Propioniciclava soli]|uniref:TraR/DksA C4-type zinc finger protein n=1 Tax=Propioniciclava soli TaxID=2775081 RepID=A0ABZ3C531_9ACTN|nr:TraR/DksA C4-type zinc finger protein [Propioniciclava soli]
MAKTAGGQGPVVPVAEGEEPWTEEELAEVREDLEFDVQRMERALAQSARGLERLFDEGTEGAGRDPADVGSSNFERDQEMSLAQNARDLLEQAQTALRLFDTGHYGVCESCGNPIGKDRLMAFPRATMCVSCKQREERR